MPSRILICLVAACCLVIAFGARPAWAQSDPLDSLTDDEATYVLDLLRQAEARREAGDCVTALVRYDEITAIVWLPQIRLRAAACYESVGQVASSEAALRDVIERGDEAVADEARAQLEQLGLDHPAVLSLAVSGQAAEVYVDDTLVGTLQDERAEFELTPGQHALRVTSPGHDTVEMSLELGVGERASHSLSFATAVPAPPPPVEPERRSLVVPLTLAGASAASFATAGVMWGRSNTLYDDWEAELTDESPALSELNRLQTRSENAARNGNIMAGVGGGLALAAIITVFVPRRGDDAGDDVSLTPLLDGRRVGAGLGWRW